MANYISLLAGQVFHKPVKVSAEPFKTDYKMTPEDAEMFRKIGIVQNDVSELYQQATLINFERHNFYREIDRSLTHPLMRAAVELYSDVAATYSQIHAATVWVTAESRHYENELNQMLDTIDIEEKIFDWTWNTAAYGDLFVKVVAIPGQGVVAVEDDIHPLDISRVDINGRLVGFYETPLTHGAYDKRLMPPWEYVHFRLLGAKKKRPAFGDPTYSEYRSTELYSPEVRRISTKYGTSILTNAVPVWKRLRMGEDCLMLARLSRGIVKYIYKVQVTGNNNEAIASLIDTYTQTLKRTRAMDIDTDSPNYEDRFLAMSALEDLIIPVWGNVDNLDVEKLGGDVDIKWITDIEELRNMLASALRVPLQLLGGYTSDLPGSLGTSALEKIDIRFARAARRLQRTMIEGIYRLCQIHLAYKAMSPDPQMFDVNMPETSTAEEEELRDALDKGVDVVDKLADLVLRTFGEEQVNKVNLFDLLNNKILKFQDLDSNEVLKSVNEQQLREAVDKRRKTKHAIYKKSSDLRSLLPVEASVRSLTENKASGVALNETWNKLYGEAHVKGEVYGSKGGKKNGK